MSPPELNTYSDDEIQRRLADELPGWSYEDGWIRRTYATDGWPTTLLLVNHIGFLAEAAFHHPDLAVSWDELDVELRTHDADGITDRDFELAAKIEASALWRPQPGSALDGTPDAFVEGGQGSG